VPGGMGEGVEIFIKYLIKENSKLIKGGVGLSIRLYRCMSALNIIKKRYGIRVIFTEGGK